MGVTATIRSTGDKAFNDIFSTVFVQGAYNQGVVLEWKEVKTAAFHPGEVVEWIAGAAGEDNVRCGQDASVHLAGFGELDLGQIASCSVDYTAADEVPVIILHWNPGALLRNIQIVDPTAALQPGTALTTNSGTGGSLDDTAGGCTPCRSYKHVPDPAAAAIVVAFISSHI